MNSASSATSVRICCASIRTASDGPDTSVDVVAAKVPAPCSKGRNGPMNTSACRSALPPLALLIRTTPLAEEVLYVGGELGMVLEQEPMGRVGIDLDLRT